MLTVTMTPNLLGIRVAGDYDGLDKLYDAVSTLDDLDWEEDERIPEVEACIRERLLALNYDLRHAYQGDRNVELVDNGMSDEIAAWSGHEDVTTYQNVVYSVEILYPEALFELICLNWLIDRRHAKLLGKKTAPLSEVTNSKILFDEPCARVRLYQSLVMEAIRKRVPSNSFSRIRSQVCDHYVMVGRMYPQWLDVINGDWMGMTAKQRAKGMSTCVRDIASYWRNPEYNEVKAGIDEFMRDRGAPLANVSLNVDYPDVYEW